MPNRDGSPTRREKAAARRLNFHQVRIAAAKTPVEALNAGFAYLAAVIKQKAGDDPRKADEITVDATDYLLKQANAHTDMTSTTTRGGTR